MKEAGQDLFGETIIKNDLLRDVYIVPPFTVIDTKTGEWRARRTKWLALGIKSELGRSAKLISKIDEQTAWGGYKNNFELNEGETNAKTAWSGSGTSIFDPVICEIAYRWFGVKGGKILDPFAGGSVRGIIASYLGFSYTGLELRQEQVASNIEQADQILGADHKALWVQGDSDVSLEHIKPDYDMIFSCPPYADLEVYSDDPSDLSNMPYPRFLEKYRSIIKKSVDKLKENSFAVFVVGDVRDKRGFYYDFVSHTKQAFIDAGAPLYNECILLNAIGSAPVRASMIFKASKKTIKIHQNILVFYKGDPAEIKEKFKNN